MDLGLKRFYEEYPVAECPLYLYRGEAGVLLSVKTGKYLTIHDYVVMLIIHTLTKLIQILSVSIIILGKIYQSIFNLLHD